MANSQKWPHTRWPHCLPLGLIGYMHVSRICAVSAVNQTIQPSPFLFHPPSLFFFPLVALEALGICSGVCFVSQPLSPTVPPAEKSCRLSEVPPFIHFLPPPPPLFWGGGGGGGGGEEVFSFQRFSVQSLLPRSRGLSQRGGAVKEGELSNRGSCQSRKKGEERGVS